MTGTINLIAASNIVGVVNAKDYGAVGDGVTDDTTALQSAITAAFVVATSNSSTQPPGNRVLYIPPGIYKTTSSLTLTGTFGAILRGAGRFTTQINNTAGSNAFTTQGFQYNRFEDFSVQTAGSGIGIEVTWDGVNNCSLQQCTFENMNFAGAGAGAGGFGVTIGDGGHQGDGMTFINCSFSSLGIGIFTTASNALATRVYGGDFQGCATAIKVGVGSVPVISGTSFEANTTWDIDIEGSANDCYSVHGCRSESPNFMNFVHGNAFISGCTHNGSSNGTFVSTTGNAVGIYNCVSRSGQADCQSQGRSEVVCSEFGRSDWGTTANRCYVRQTWVGGTIDDTGGVTLLRDGFVSGSSYFNQLIRAINLTDAATVTTDASLGTFFVLTINGNRTLANPTGGMLAGITLTWEITQGAGGSHTLAYDTLFTWPGGVAPTLSTAAGAVDVITATVNGTATALRASIQKAFA